MFSLCRSVVFIFCFNKQKGWVIQDVYFPFKKYFVYLNPVNPVNPVKNKSLYSSRIKYRQKKIQK